MDSYFVYKHVSPSNKVYIGITRQTNPEIRWQNGTGYKDNSYFTNAIKKYGWNNFKHIILAKGLTEEEAKTLEIKLIAKYKSNIRKYGYNISSGGESRRGTHLSDEHKQKISAGNLGKIVSDETRKKLSENAKKTWSNKNHRQYMKDINLGINNPMYGKHLTQEQLKKRKLKPVIQYDLSGNKIVEYASMGDAFRATKIHNIQKCCKGEYKQCGGYIWRWK